MNWNLAKSRLGRLVTAGAFIGATFAASAAEVIVNGGFGTNAAPSLSGWTLLTGTANARPSTDSINDGLGPPDNLTVFDLGDASFFDTEAFAVLGDNVGRTRGNPNSGFSILYQDFALGGSGPWTLDISFRSAFGGAGVGDVFGAVLCSPGGVLGCGGGFFNTLFTQTLAGSQLNNNPFATTLSGLAPDTYRLMFALLELRGGGSTAAGIDNVSINAMPLPPAVWLLGSALVGLVAISRRKSKVV